jgi:hypothetical protein
MVLREKPGPYRATPDVRCPRRSSAALYDRVAAQLRHSLLTGEDEDGGADEKVRCHPHLCPSRQGEDFKTQKPSLELARMIK